MAVNLDTILTPSGGFQFVDRSEAETYADWIFLEWAVQAAYASASSCSHDDLMVVVKVVVVYYVVIDLIFLPYYLNTSQHAHLTPPFMEVNDFMQKKYLPTKNSEIKWVLLE